MLQNPFTLAIADWSNTTSALSEAGSNPLDVIETALTGRLDLLNHPRELVDAMSQVHPVWASIFLIVGGMCIFNGFKWHKSLILLLSAMLGAAAGLWVGGKIGGAHNVSAAAFAVLFVILALPGLRFAVALFGGLTGAFLGANAWTALGGAGDSHYVGALIGLMGLGMLAFITFRLVIVLFTAIGGASLVVLGGLALMLKIDAWSSGTANALSANHLIVPFVTGVVAIVGVVVQQGGGVRALYSSADKCAGKGKAKAA